MKRSLGFALVALPLVAASLRANGQLVPPYRLEFGGNIHFNLLPLQPNASQLGPWYLYWPMEAHFVVPAPTGYPYWPGPQTLPPGLSLGSPGQQPAPAPGPMPAPGMFSAPTQPTPPPPPSPVRPAACIAPAYWYSR